MSDGADQPAEFAQPFAATLWGDEPSPLSADNHTGVESKPRQRDPSAPLCAAAKKSVMQKSTAASLAAAALLGVLIALGIRTYRGTRRTAVGVFDAAYGRPRAGAQHSVVTHLLVTAKPSNGQEGAARV